jgi:transposase-like protein
MPKNDSGASASAPLLDGSSACELIPELVHHGLQQLIELEVAAAFHAERHEDTKNRGRYRNGSLPWLLTTQVGDIPLSIPMPQGISEGATMGGHFLPSLLDAT